MSLNINEVTIAGNICKDIEIRQAGNSQVASFSVATNEKWKDKSGNEQQKTEFHNCVFWGKQAETVAKFFKKGDPIYLKGKIVTESYEKDGVKRYSTKINCFSFQFVASKQSGQQQGGYQQPQNNGGQNFNQGGNQQQDSHNGFEESNIPF